MRRNSTRWNNLCGHLKEHELGNLLVRQAHDLGFHATTALRRLRRRPKIIAACWKQYHLPLSLYYASLSSISMRGNGGEFVQRDLDGF